MDYLLVINGKPEGPFTIDELKQRRIKAEDFVRTEGMDDYREAHEIPELRKFFGFPNIKPEPQYFGSFDQRLLAAALDCFFVSTACSVFALAAVLLTSGRVAQIVIILSLSAIIPVVNMIYHIVMECSVRQATYGKQILKIRVTNLSGERINVSRATGRNLAKIFSVVTLFIGYLMAFFNRKQQCLHDMMADTVVIKDRL